MNLHEFRGFALANPCYLAGECAKRCYASVGKSTSIVLTVNAGYE